MSKRPTRKAEAPSMISVPGVRAVINDVEGEAPASALPPKPAVAKPRKRRPKFVF